MPIFFTNNRIGYNTVTNGSITSDGNINVTI